MTDDILMFFDGHMDVLPLYEQLETRILDQIPKTEIRTAKTQLSFFARKMYACVSFSPVRRKNDRPLSWLTVSFGLDRCLGSPRIDAVSEPYPNRWTHHVMIGTPEEIDGELLGWLKEAADFAKQKRGEYR